MTNPDPNLAQIVVAPEMTTALVTAMLALQAWMVRRLFFLDKKLALITQRLEACKCMLGKQTIITDD